MFEFAGEPCFLIVLDVAALRHIGVEPDEVRLRGLQCPEWIGLLHGMAGGVARLKGNAAILRTEIPYPG